MVIKDCWGKVALVMVSNVRAVAVAISDIAFELVIICYNRHTKTNVAMELPISKEQKN